MEATSYVDVARAAGLDGLGDTDGAAAVAERGTSAATPQASRDYVSAIPTKNTDAVKAATVATSAADSRR